MEQKNFWRRFNPTLKDKMEENPNLTILGLWWAWYWRLMVLVFSISLAFVIVVVLLVKIFS